MKYALSLVIFFLLPHLAFSNTVDPTSWAKWRDQFKQEAVENGIEPDFFDYVFSGIIPSKRVIKFDRTQPEKRLTYLEYRKSRIDPYRIQLGRKKYKKYQPLLEEIAQVYGIDPCVIVALWGMESSYGHFMGNFPVIKSLATLAYDGRRAAFFRKELLNALHILQGGHVSMADFKGEWAGASGMPQFLPSSWINFAVDYDKDGKKDIWKTHADVFASIANYLVKNGWQTGEPWSIPVSLSEEASVFLNEKEQKSVIEWWDLGVRPSSGVVWPEENYQATIIRPYGGPTFLVFDNFNVIMRYNRSTFYAGSIGFLADQICQR